MLSLDKCWRYSNEEPSLLSKPHRYTKRKPRPIESSQKMLAADVGLKESIEKGKTLGQMEMRESHPKLDWDQKRKETRVVNPFAGWAVYPPQPEMPEKMMKRGRPRKNN